ncbi:MAG: hypothetical protein JW919_06120 [Candidatus Omnitrophica bacterium]|nr:hypothetical protein [Candidatus Omnitrophota bacterium]
MGNKLLMTACIIGLCLAFPNDISAQYVDNEDPFFSYKKFYLQLDILENASRDKSLRNDVRAFMRSFADGIYAISAGDLEDAEKALLKARAIWPEYFGTDFLLARVNEDTRDYKLSAKFYKSYLNKLKALSEGRYRISAPIMQGITPYRIENYNDAYALVKRRLENHGIDLALVSPFYAMPGLLKFLIICVTLGLAYVIMAYKVIPYIKRKRQANNPPEGYWVCKKCGALNLNVRLECEKCGQKHDTAGIMISGT